MNHGFNVKIKLLIHSIMVNIAGNKTMAYLWLKDLREMKKNERNMQNNKVAIIAKIDGIWP